MIEGNAVNLHDPGRNHVGRLPLKDKAFEVLYIDHIITDNICCDRFSRFAHIPGVSTHVTYAGILAYHAFHLGKLYPESPDLNLTVGTAYEIHFAVRKKPYHITGTVGTSVSRIVAERILNECFFGDLRTV